MGTNPTFLRVPDPSNGTGQLTHSPVALDHTVARWLREGAPRVTSRTHLNPSTRPFIPMALFSFFDGVIGLPQCSHLISQHLANSREHVRTASQEFTRADGTLKFSYTHLTTEIVNCCSSYQLSQPSPAGLPPILLLVPRFLITTPTSPTQSEPLPRAKERAKERAKAKANGKVKTHPLMPVPLTLHELKVRVQLKGKIKAKPSNPQHFLPPCPLGRPSRVVRSASTPFVIYRSSSQYTLEEKRVKARLVSLDPFASREDRTDEGKRGVVVKGLRSRRELHWRREVKEVQEIHQR